MLKTFESVLGLILMFGAFFVFVQPGHLSVDSPSKIKTRVQETMLNLLEDNSFRAKVLSVKKKSDLNNLKEYLLNYLDYSIEAEVCDLKNVCIGSKPPVTNYVTTNILVDGNASNKTAKKVRVYAWVFRGKAN